MINYNEKSGGNWLNNTRVDAYRDCINFCNFMDIGFIGPPFHLCNKRFNHGLIKERLDRVWATGNWRTLFPASKLLHLARVHSDHCPLLLDLDYDSAPSGSKLFRFEKFWINHPDFRALVAHFFKDNHLDLRITKVALLRGGKGRIM